MKLRICFIGVFCILMITSCVPNKRFARVVNEKQIFHDTLLNANQTIQKQVKEIDSLNKVIKKQALADEENTAKFKKEYEKLFAELKAKEQTLDELKRIVNEQQQAVYDLEQQVCDALQCFTPDELNVEVKNGKLYVSLSDKLLFPSGSDKVNDRGKEAIDQLAQVLKGSDMEIVVEGHTDTVPISNVRNKDNWDLSVHRATSVTRLLSQYGIKQERITAAGRSKFIPVSDNQTQQGRQLNRRTEIVLAPKLDELWKLTEQENILEDNKLSNLLNE